MAEEASDSQSSAENPEKGGGTEKSGGIRGILITSGFTLLGAILGVLGTGYFNLQAEKTKSNAEIQLEHQKFDSELVKIAIAAPAEKDRVDFLRFMVIIHLISDPQIREGVLSYLPPATKEEPKIVPRYQPFPITQSSRLPPAGSTPAPGTTAAEQLEGAVEIARQLWSGQYDAIRSNFNDWLMSNLSTQTMQESSEKFIRRLGKLITATPGPPSTKDGTLFINVLCKSENGSATVQVWYDKDGKVTGLWIVPGQTQ
jgi:hypothetical protein